MADLPEYTMEEVAAHNTMSDLWLVIHGNVYDCTAFIDVRAGKKKKKKKKKSYRSPRVVGLVA